MLVRAIRKAVRNFVLTFLACGFAFLSPTTSDAASNENYSLITLNFYSNKMPLRQPTHLKAKAVYEPISTIPFVNSSLHCRMGGGPGDIVVPFPDCESIARYYTTYLPDKAMVWKGSQLTLRVKPTLWRASTYRLREIELTSNDFEQTIEFSPIDEAMGPYLYNYFTYGVPAHTSPEVVSPITLVTVYERIKSNKIALSTSNDPIDRDELNRYVHCNDSGCTFSDTMYFIDKVMAANHDIKWGIDPQLSKKSLLTMLDTPGFFHNPLRFKNCKAGYYQRNSHLLFINVLCKNFHQKPLDPYANDRDNPSPKPDITADVDYYFYDEKLVAVSKDFEDKVNIRRYEEAIGLRDGRLIYWSRGGDLFGPEKVVHSFVPSESNYCHSYGAGCADEVWREQEGTPAPQSIDVPGMEEEAREYLDLLKK